MFFRKPSCAIETAEATIMTVLVVVWDGKGTNAVSPMDLPR